MKRIVLCFDGTWNAVSDPNSVTNVVKIANGVAFSAKDGTPQIVYYNSGVGSGGPIDRFLGGAFGAGLLSNVKRGLAFLALNYEQRPPPQKSDEIYIFGFSRGAYTARALAGVVGTAGIPKDFRESETHWNFYRAFSKLKLDAHKARGDAELLASLHDEMEAKMRELTQHARYPADTIDIRCVGVWDTVGAYGVPMGFGLGGLSRVFTYWTRGFRDTEIGKKVQLGLHALAIDEKRSAFTPTFWTLGRISDGKAPPPIDAERVEQVWFPGVHSNIGGGYEDSGLSDLALAWMVARVQKAGLEFLPDFLATDMWPCVAATLYESDRGWLMRRDRRVLPIDEETLPARIMRWIRSHLGIRNRDHNRVNETVHWSALKRRQCSETLVDEDGFGPYAPVNLAANIDKVSTPLPLERELMAADRDWAGHCPLKGKRACLCRELMHDIAAQA
jgi:uncharacterized protein (DUF2235 family)